MGNIVSYQLLKISKERIDADQNRQLQGISVAMEYLRSLGMSSAGQGKIFFGRKRELDQLLMILSSPPRRPVVVIGPQGSGKTTLLKQVQRVCQFHLPVIQIVGGVDVSTPAALAEIIKAEVLEWLDAFLGSRDVSPTSGFKEKVASAAKVNVLPAAVIAKLRAGVAVCNSLGQLLFRLRKFVAEYGGSFQTTIVIDEAERLKAWSRDHQVDLEMLIRFFSWMTKQEGYAHVFFVSSDGSFMDWLHSQEILEYRLLTVGNFSKEEARQFFKKHCFIGRQRMIEIHKDWSPYWEEIHELTGGSPSQLITLSEMALYSHLSWDEALKKIMENAARALASSMTKYLGAMRRLGLDAATTVVAAMKTLVEYEGCVPVDVMLEVFSDMRRNQARKCLLEMVEYKIFQLRYRKPGSMDRDLELPLGCEDHTFITPYQPAQLKVMMRYDYMAGLMKS